MMTTMRENAGQTAAFLAGLGSATSRKFGCGWKEKERKREREEKAKTEEAWSEIRAWRTTSRTCGILF